MLNNRDRTSQILPTQLLDDLLDDGTYAQLVADSYQPPRNAKEAEVHAELLALGRNFVLRKGWPDFCVVTNQGMFAVEVKHGADWLSPSQRVVTDMLARAGIDTYVASRSFSADKHVYEAVGDSTPWDERAQEEA